MRGQYGGAPQPQRGPPHRPVRNARCHKATRRRADKARSAALEPARVVALEHVQIALVGSGEVEREVALRGLCHVVRPDVHGEGLAIGFAYAVDTDQRFPAFRVTDPHGGAKAWRVANVPGVGEVVRGSGLAGGGVSYLLIQVVEHGRCAVFHHAPQDLRLDRGFITAEHALAPDLVVVDRLGLAVTVPFYALDRVGLAVDAAAGERRVGRGHVEWAYARAEAAYGGRRVGIYGARDAEVFGRLDHAVQAHVGGELDEDRVIRLGHRV